MDESHGVKKNLHCPPFRDLSPIIQVDKQSMET